MSMFGFAYSVTPLVAQFTKPVWLAFPNILSSNSLIDPVIKEIQYLFILAGCPLLSPLLFF